MSKEDLEALVERVDALEKDVKVLAEAHNALLDRIKALEEKAHRH